MTGAADAKFMREALTLALEAWGMTNPNPMVGAVIVRDGKVVGRGYHHRAGLPHAEIEALADARRNGFDPKGAALYVTLEPCSTHGRTGACTEAIVAAGLSKVVVGVTDPNPAHAGRGIAILRRAGIEVDTGVLEAECAEVNRSFFKWITSGRPLVTLKLATTLDGRIATASGCSKWITGAEARSRVQKLRRLADAVMVGGGTWRADRPSLTVRDVENWPCQPLRVIVSKRLTREEVARCYPDGRFEVVDLPDRAAWEVFLSGLGRRNMVNVLIEGGGELAASALAAQAVDRVEFHIAPKILGGAESRPAVGGKSPETLAEALELKNVRVERLGNDVMMAGDL